MNIEEREIKEVERASVKYEIVSTTHPKNECLNKGLCVAMEVKKVVEKKLKINAKMK